MEEGAQKSKVTVALKSHNAVLPASAAVSEDRPSAFLVALMHRPDQREYRWAKVSLGT